MPIVLFGEGGCLAIGTMYPAFLTEIASHGYLVLANGPLMKERFQAAPQTVDISGIMQTLRRPQTKVQDLTDSIDWAIKGAGAKYGNIDTTKIAAMGQSCGGLEGKPRKEGEHKTQC
jgi:dienelactone hydrolase